MAGVLDDRFAALTRRVDCDGFHRVCVLLERSVVRIGDYKPECGYDAGVHFGFTGYAGDPVQFCGGEYDPGDCAAGAVVTGGAAVSGARIVVWGGEWATRRMGDATNGRHGETAAW